MDYNKLIQQFEETVIGLRYSGDLLGFLDASEEVFAQIVTDIRRMKASQTHNEWADARERVLEKEQKFTKLFKISLGKAMTMKPPKD